MNRLDGKVALVTGSSQGIGRSIALRFANEGAKVVVNYHRTPGHAEDVLNEIKAAGSDGFIVKADVSNVDEVRGLINAGVEHFGRLDVLVNNAGIEKNAPFWEVTEADYDSVLNVNLKGAFFAAQAMVQHLMSTRRKGKIINISSVHEELPFPNFAAYCLSKGGLKMMARNLSVELGPLGININNIAPGAIETPMNKKLLENPQKLKSLMEQIPLGRLGQPQDVAGLAVFLASDDADYVTGATFYIDGGLTWDYHEQ